MIEILMDFWTILAPFWEPSWSHVGHFFRPRRPKMPPRRPKMPNPNGICSLLGASWMPLGIDQFWDASWDRFFTHLGSILEDFWKNMSSKLPPQTYFRKKPASTNSLSKKASQNLRGRRCSPQALAIRRPLPAGCMGVFKIAGKVGLF